MRNKANSGVIPGAEGRTNFGAGGVRTGVISTSNVPKVDPKAKPAEGNKVQSMPAAQPMASNVVQATAGVQPTTGVAQATQPAQGGQMASSVQPAQSGQAIPVTGAVQTVQTGQSVTGVTQPAQVGQSVVGVQSVQAQPAQPARPQLTVPTTIVTSNTAKEQAKQARKMKPPMDPAKKKKIITLISVIAGAVAFVTVGVVVLILILKVDYSETYRAAKELKAEINEYTSSNDCQYAVNNVDAVYVSEQRYAEYVEGCIVAADGIDEETSKLESTQGVKRNKGIREQFERYKEAMGEAVADREDLEKKLALYKAWHSYEVAIDGKTADVVTEEEIRAAAEILINSGNEVLKAYGEGWQEKTAVYALATQEYYAAAYDNPNKSALRSEMERARGEQKAWIAENKPDVAEITPIELGGKTVMMDEFTKLYGMITKAYQENYKKGSGDCTEFRGEVICS